MSLSFIFTNPPEDEKSRSRGAQAALQGLQGLELLMVYSWCRTVFAARCPGASHVYVYDKRLTVPLRRQDDDLTVVASPSSLTCTGRGHSKRRNEKKACRWKQPNKQVRCNGCSTGTQGNGTNELWYHTLLLALLLEYISQGCARSRKQSEKGQSRQRVEDAPDFVWATCKCQELSGT